MSVGECTLPLTGERCVHRVITDVGVLDALDVTPVGPLIRRTAMLPFTGSPAPPR